MPRILYITSQWPGAPAYGSQQRLLQVGQLLQRVGHVSLVVVDFYAEAARWRRRTEALFDTRRVIDVKAPPPPGFLGRLRHEFDPAYLQTRPITVDDCERRGVLNLMVEHDMVWIHTIAAANAVGITDWPRSVLDIDDLPSRLYRSSLAVDEGLISRLRDLRMSAIWRRRERRLADRFSVLLVCSEGDRQYLRMPGRVSVLPNGFERVADLERRPADPPRLGFIGTFKWWPNADGVRWFCKEVWPGIRRRMPGSRLRLIGDESEVATDWGEGVEPLGRIDDPGPEICTWAAMIVPIRAGGGTRIKVAEAFARRCPAVATTLGAFGYDVRDGEELFLCDQPDSFAFRCVELMESPERGNTMAARAHRRFLRSWTWESYQPIVEAAVAAAYESGRSRSGREIARTVGGATA